MKHIKAFFAHSLIRLTKAEKHNNNFFYCQRFYAGYVGIYTNCKPLNFSFTLWLFKPTKECKESMMKEGSYSISRKQWYKTRYN